MIILSTLCLLLRVAFWTLFERKILAGIIIRQGPIKVGTYGILQPLADGLKLFIKRVYIFNIKSFLSNLVIILIPIILLRTLVSVNFLMPIRIYLIFILPFFATLIRVFTYLIRNSLPRIFHKISGQRILCISIGLEFTFFIALFILIISEGRFYKGRILLIVTKENSLISLSLVFIFIYILYIILEGARVPFDHLEAERELVRGFNTEYRGLRFAIIFVGENALLLTWIIIIGYIFLPKLSMMIPLLLISFLVVLTIIRGALPRIYITTAIRFTFLRLACIIFPLLFLFFFFYFCIWNFGFLI